MIRILRSFATPLLLALLLSPAVAKPSVSAVHVQRFRVRLDSNLKQPVSGRLLIFAKLRQGTEITAHGKAMGKVDISPLEPARTAVAAMEVMRLAPGGAVQMNADVMAFPQPFSALKPGAYNVQAVLDVNHNYNYSGRGAGDLVSKVVTVQLGGGRDSMPMLELTRELAPRMQAWTLPARMPAVMRSKYQPAMDAARAHSRKIDFVSPALSAFWGRSVHMRGWVLLPPGYAEHKSRHYPTVYFTPGYGASLSTLTYDAASTWRLMASGATPPMIWVLLDESSATGTHEFADSVNNGPWGAALTTGLIPKLESTYRMDAHSSGRFLTGHSSGGWATLWLQVRYPKVFGGTWSTSPDPGDFHDFTGPDLYAPHANVYHKADGTPWPLVRDKGKVVASFEQFAKLERVLGPYGGQMASFEWVFSPRGKDGRPEPMFDRITGEVKPEVVDYWRRHYDIAYRIKTRWTQLKPYLDGKIHLYVGTADTFYLNVSARKLKAVLDGVGAKSSFHFLRGKTHFDLYAKGGDRKWLYKEIAWQMYHTARPKAKVPLTGTTTAPQDLSGHR